MISIPEARLICNPDGAAPAACKLHSIPALQDFRGIAIFLGLLTIVTPPGLIASIFLFIGASKANKLMEGILLHAQKSAVPLVVGTIV